MFLFVDYSYLAERYGFAVNQIELAEDLPTLDVVTFVFAAACRRLLISCWLDRG